MKAVEARMLDFLKQSPQFIIPIYQRTYSWTERECRQLWKDILRAGSNELISSHFVGSVVYIADGIYQVANQSQLLVIDGQQRLTTIMLLLEALARNLDGKEPINGFSEKKIRSYYLLNPLEDGERAYKLLLTQTDKESLLALVEQREFPREHSFRIKENFEFFESQIKKLGSDLEALCKGIAKLVIVDISLSREQDNPQLIFESMNSTGRELSQADLIRNFILMGLEPNHQTKLYKDYWRPMETTFGQSAYNTQFDGFVRNYLTLKTGRIPNKNAVYEAFKSYARTKFSEQKSVDDLVEDLYQFAHFYSAIALGTEEDKELAKAFQDIRELRVDVAYPFFLELYHDYKHGNLAKDDFLAAVRLVESYVFRRAVCLIPTNSLNKTFANIGRNLKKDRYLESLEAHFLSLPSYRRFPKNDEFQRELKTRDLYNFRNRSYWLRRLENYGRKERVPVDEYTIEHILPQNSNLRKEWVDALGPDWKNIQEKWLHTLGNLTLTGYNSEYSDQPFANKRDMSGGFKESPLRLNEGLGQLEVWDEEAILVRANRLSEKCTDVWPMPILDEEVLEAYQSQTEATSNYTIDDHRFLHPSEPMHSLFQAFRKEVLALDPLITEDILKLYIAYKAETNFVDVVPQKSRLRLSLNMKFHEIVDPKGICKDVTDISRWGNGDVQIHLNSHSELPYVMGLVRQSLEKQMSSAEDS